MKTEGKKLEDAMLHFEDRSSRVWLGVQGGRQALEAGKPKEQILSYSLQKHSNPSNTLI